jgi:PAS domain S-box-containing protein
MQHTPREKQKAMIKNFPNQDELLLQHIFHIVPIPMVLTEIASGRIVDMNNMYCEYMGYEREALMGQESLQFYASPDDRSCLLNQLEISGYIYNQELCIKRKNDETAWLLISMKKVNYHQLALLLTTFVDITSWKQDYAEHRRLEQEYRAVLEHSPEMIARFDNELRHIYLNPALLRLIGAELKTCLGKSHLELGFPAKLAAFLDKTLKMVLASRREVTIEFSHIMGGQEHFYEAQVIPELDHSGKVESVLAITRDISQRRQMEVELRIRERAMDAANVGIVIADASKADLPAIYLNQAFEKLTGFSSSETLGKNLHFLHSENQDSAVIKKLKTTFQEGKEADLVLQNYRKDGSIFWNELHIAPVFDEDKKLSHFIGIQKDITERLEAESELNSLNQMLEERNRELLSLHTIGKALSYSLDLQEIYHALYYEIGQKLLKSEFFCLAWHQAGTEHFICNFVANSDVEVSSRECPSLELEASLIENMMHSEQALILSQVNPCSKSEKLYSTMYIPLIVGQEIMGIIYVQRTEELPFSEYERQLMSSLAPQAAVGLSNAQLFYQVQNHAQELHSLYNAISALFQSRNLLDLAQQITKAVVGEFKFADCGLFLYQAPQRELQRIARAGDYYIAPSLELVIDGPGLVAAAIRNKGMIYAPSVKDHPSYLIGNSQTQSELVIPLISSNAVLGALDLQSTELHAFSEAEQRILLAFAERAASAIEIVRLYEQLDNHAADLEWRVAQRTVELLRAKEAVETILNSIQDTVVLVDNDFNIQQVNPAFSELFGYESETFLLEPIYELFANDHQEILTSITQVVRSQKSARMEWVARHKSGKLFEVDVVFSPIVSEKSIQHIVCSVRDASAQKQLEERLRASLQEAQELAELKSRFSSMVSHEFRTPLAVIHSAVDILEVYAERLSPEKRLEKLHKVKRQVSYLTHLMDNILFISKGEAVGLLFQPTPLDYLGFAQSLIEEIETSSPRFIPVDLDYSGDWQQLWGDERLLRQILQNLLSNALKYSSEGGRVELSMNAQEDIIEFLIRDHGIGIPQASQIHLFEAFHRANNVGTIQGTGLGLVIVKRAVEAYQGKIEFSSSEGQGTIFRVTLPKMKGALDG